MPWPSEALGVFVSGQRCHQAPLFWDPWGWMLESPNSTLPFLTLGVISGKAWQVATCATDESQRHGSGTQCYEAFLEEPRR